MIIDRFRLTGNGVSIDLRVRGDVSKDRYIVRHVDGLGPPDYDVGVTQLFSDGGWPGSVRAQSRQIVFTIEMNRANSAAETPERLRNRLYSLFGNKNEVTISAQLGTDGGPTGMRLLGRVSKMEMAPFDPQNLIQLTVVSHMAYWEASVETILTNPTLIQSKTFVNDFTAPTGFLLEFTMPANTSTLTIVVSGMGNIVLSLPGYPTAIRMKIDSWYTTPYVSYSADSGATWYSAMLWVYNTTTWPRLAGGSNIIYYTGATASSVTTQSLRYFGKFLGV